MNLLPIMFSFFPTPSLTLERPLDRLPTQGLSQKSCLIAFIHKKSTLSRFVRLKINASETQLLVNLLLFAVSLFLSLSLTLSRPLHRLPTQVLSQKSCLIAFIHKKSPFSLFLLSKIKASETHFLVNLLSLTFSFFPSPSLTLSRSLHRLPTQGVSQKSCLIAFIHKKSTFLVFSEVENERI